MIHYLVGDATRPDVSGLKVIAHVCNDIGAWGRGFVMALSHRWSEPARQYRHWHSRRLGSIQCVKVEPDIIVCNMIAQKGVLSRGGVPPIRYGPLGMALALCGGYARRHNASVHMPRIGCGLAGGSWAKVEPIIEQKMFGLEVYVYDLGRGTRK